MSCIPPWYEELFPDHDKKPHPLPFSTLNRALQEFGMRFSKLTDDLPKAPPFWARKPLTQKLGPLGVTATKIHIASQTPTPLSLWPWPDPPPSPSLQVVEVAESSRCCLLEACLGTKAPEQRHRADVLWVGKGAEVELLTFQPWRPEANHVSIRDIYLEADASLHWIDLHRGAAPPTLQTFLHTEPGARIKVQLGGVGPLTSAFQIEASGEVVVETAWQGGLHPKLPRPLAHRPCPEADLTSWIERLPAEYQVELWAAF